MVTYLLVILGSLLLLVRKSLDTPSLSIVGETANLRPVFDEIIVRDKITVDDANLESYLKVSYQLTKT